jgi:hypothetical protein
LLGAELPRGSWDTVGGLMLDLMGRVPDNGDSVDVDGFRLTAVDVRGRRIGRVRIERSRRAGGDEHDEHDEQDRRDRHAGRDRGERDDRDQRDDVRAGRAGDASRHGS